jgi:flagellar motility protein MotE (MotC chaperone)
MKAMPRLLPLIAVSIGGVLAVKALNSAQAFPDLFSPPSAHAESAPPAKPAAQSKATPPTPQPAAPKPPPACITSPAEIAREAGLSAGELQTIQNLETRRGQLDDREKALDTQLQLLAAAETKVDAKIKAMNAVKGQIQALLGQADQQQQADVDRLTSVYQKMKPADAAAVMATLDDSVRVPVAAKMKDAALAAILGKMPTAEAKKLTESLAQRAAAAKAAVKQAEQAPALVAAAAPPPSPDPTEPAPRPKAQSKGRAKTAGKRRTPHEAAAAQADPTPVPGTAPPKSASVPASASGTPAVAIAKPKAS